MERVSKASFLFLLCRQLISCSDLLLISKGVSQPEGVEASLQRENKENIKSIQLDPHSIQMFGNVETKHPTLHYCVDSTLEYTKDPLSRSPLCLIPRWLFGISSFGRENVSKESRTMQVWVICPSSDLSFLSPDDTQLHSVSLWDKPLGASNGAQPLEWGCPECRAAFQSLDFPFTLFLKLTALLEGRVCSPFLSRLRNPSCFYLWKKTLSLTHPGSHWRMLAPGVSRTFCERRVCWCILKAYDGGYEIRLCLWHSGVC